MKTNVFQLLKRVGIVSGALICVNFLGVLILDLISQDGNILSFLRHLMLCLMFEGSILALLGSFCFLGLEKYRRWLKLGNSPQKQKENEIRSTVKGQTRSGLGVLLVSVGILLFTISLTFYSLIF